MAIKISDLAKIASKTSYVNQAIKRDLNKQGLSPDRTVSDKKGEKLAESWKEKGLVKKTYRSAGNIVRETHKYLAEKNKQEAPVQSAKTQKKVGKGNLGKVAQAQQVIMGGKRGQSSVSGQNAAHSASQLQETRTSALTPKAAPGRAETTTSIFRSRKTAEKKSAPEEKPQAVDLVID